MIIENVTLRQFRCFEERTVPFDGRFVIIEGPNGSGKSSLLEALHYCCYLRSFRTRLHKELVQLGKDYFFVEVKARHKKTGEIDNIHVGFSDEQGKVVKWNERSVQTYKDLIAHFKIVTVVADDVELVQGGPEVRRDFLNYALMLADPGLLSLFKQYRQILEQRNSLLATRNAAAHDETFIVWTQKLWEGAQAIRQRRIEYLSTLEQSVNELMQSYFSLIIGADLRITFDYAAKNMTDDCDFEKFWRAYEKSHYLMECDYGRSMFGTHLDDFSTTFQNKRARIYASRGQQKLLVFLVKLAQLIQLSTTGGQGILLLDDFMTDFDHIKVEMCMQVLKDLHSQVFLSSPINPIAFLGRLLPSEICHVYL